MIIPFVSIGFVDVLPAKDKVGFTYLFTGQVYFLYFIGNAALQKLLRLALLANSGVNGVLPSNSRL